MLNDSNAVAREGDRYGMNDKVAAMPRVEAELQHAERVLDEQAKLIENLALRLSPVLSPQPRLGECGEPKGGPRAALSPVAERLERLAGAASRNNEALVDLLGRLEVG